MNNIFEGAKFGDKFLTRGDRKFIYFDTNQEGYSYGRIEGCATDSFYDSDGLDIDWLKRPKKSIYDIVSRYQEPVDENKLDELAFEESPNRSIYVESSDLTCAWMEGFKVGYRKAKEK